MTILTTAPDIAKAFLALLISGAAAAVTTLAILVSVREFSVWTRETGIAGRTWQGLLFAVILDGLVLAGFGVAEFRTLYIEGWEAIVGIVGGFFGSWIAFRGYKSSKGAEVGGQPPPPAPGGGS